jgi:TRAP-type C4-dicarboxylate transport system permease small subunit
MVLLTKGFNILTNSILAIGVAAIATLVTLEAVLRYTMHAMPIGLEELALIIAAWVYFLGIALASRDRKQITVNILSVVRIGPRIAAGINLIASFFSVGASGLFAYFAIVYSLKVYTIGTTLPPFHWPAGVLVLSLPVGLVLASLYEVQELVRKLRRI